MLDPSKLEAVKQRGEKTIARCPACAEAGADNAGEHLVIYPSGKFGCCACPGDAEHRRRIFTLAGTPEAPALDSMRTRPAPMKPRKAKTEPPLQLPPDFLNICREARARVYNSRGVQSFIAAEFGIEPATVRALSMPEGGALGFFPRADYKGRPLEPDRIGYIYPRGIKIRNPWGEGKCKPRFVWLHGRATEPWRYSVAEWRPWVRHFILTEGESDLLALADCGIGTLHPNDETAVIASPGTSFVEGWAPMFAERRVTIAFDTDKAGQDAARKISRWLEPYAAGIRILKPNQQQPTS